MSVGLAAGITGFIDGMQAGERIKNRREDREWERERRDWARDDREFNVDQRERDRAWQTEQRGWARDDRDWTVSERQRLRQERKSDRAWTAEQRDRQRQEWAYQDEQRQRQRSLEEERQGLYDEFFSSSNGGPPSSAPGLPRQDRPQQSDQAPLLPMNVEAPQQEPGRTPQGNRGPQESGPARRPQPRPEAEMTLGSLVATGPESGAPGIPADVGGQEGQDPLLPMNVEPPDRGISQPPEDEGPSRTLAGDVRAGFSAQRERAESNIDKLLGIGPGIWNAARGPIEATGEYITGRNLDIPSVRGVSVEGMFGDEPATQDDTSNDDPRAPSGQETRGQAPPAPQRPQQAEREGQPAPNGAQGGTPPRGGQSEQSPVGPERREQQPQRQPQQTSQGTPAASVELVHQSVGLTGDQPSESQRERGAQEFQSRYNYEVAPKIIDFYMRNGEPQKAQAFQAFVRDRQVQTAMRHWSRAITAASLGDDSEFVNQLVEAYNADGYYDDGLSIDPEGTRLTRQGGQIRGAEITFVNDRTGDRFTRQYEGQDLYQLGIDNLSVESAFENQYQRYQQGAQARQENQPSGSDIMRAMEMLSDPMRPGSEDFNGLSLAEQRRRAIGLLQGGPGLGGGGGNGDVPVYGARD